MSTIDKIKLIREHYNCSLKMAKTIVELTERGINYEYNVTTGTLTVVDA